MTIKQATPYLFFDGTAGKAIELYERALGAKREGVMTFADMPGSTPKPEYADRVLHALLHLGEATIMLSDTEPGKPVPAGGNVQVTLAFDDAEEMDRAFQSLAEGGKVEMALHDAFWGDRFGALVDRFGIHWMFTAPLKK